MVVVKESHFEVKNIVTVWDKIWLVFEEVKYFVRPTLPSKCGSSHRDQTGHTCSCQNTWQHDRPPCKLQFSVWFKYFLWFLFCWKRHSMSEREMASLSASSQRIIVFHFPIMSHFLINQYSQIIFTFFILWKITYFFRFLNI